MAPRTLQEGAQFFTALSLVIPKASERALIRSAKLVRDEAKRVLGTYDYDWERLKPATVKQKATGDSPLLETGGLRASIKYSIDKYNGIANVGSNDPKALWHELGTVHIPPRSFLMGAAMRMEEKVHDTCGKDLFGWILQGKGPDFEDDWSYDGED